MCWTDRQTGVTKPWSRKRIRAGLLWKHSAMSQYHATLHTTTSNTLSPLTPRPYPAHLLGLGPTAWHSPPHRKEPWVVPSVYNPCEDRKARLCPARNAALSPRGRIVLAVAVKGWVGVVATDLLMIFSRESGALLLKGSSILATMAFCRSLLSITVVWGTTLGNKRITKKKKTLKQQHSL